MSKSFSKKRFTVSAIVSAIVIIAGIVLYALFGFNTALDQPKSYSFEVKCDVLIDVTENASEELQKLCEDSFRENKISYAEKSVNTVIDGNSFTDTTDTILLYTFSSGVSEEALAKSVAAVNAASHGEADVFASYHALSSERFVEPAWRGAIAIAVGAVVALAYVWIRYGLSCAVAGLVSCAHDALFTAAFFAITRFPVYAMAPVLYAAIAAFVSALLWTVQCIRMKAAYKSSAEGTPSEEVIRTSLANSWKYIVATSIALLVPVLLIGAVAVSGTALLVLPALVAIVVPVYSTLLIAPEICIPIRTAFDKTRAAKKSSYSGKKKAAATDAE